MTAQLRLDTSYSPEQLIRKYLLNEESDLIIKNVSFKGQRQSMGYFYNETPLDVINQGILLSTGDVFDAMGPNKSASTGTRGSGWGDKDLQAIATGVVMDAVALEFDLIALRDSIVFKYVFASDEYPEFVDKGVNDIFGFFLTQQNSRAIFPLNLAQVPNSRKPVSINNINHRMNEQYFLRSDFLSAHGDAYWKANPQLFLRARFLEYDGFTTILRATAKLEPGKTYHLKFAIGDVGDRIYDSAVMLKAKSFTSSGKRIPQADSIVKNEIDQKMSAFKTSYSSNKDLSFSLQINFNTNEAIILESSFDELNELVAIMEEFQDLNIEIIGHTDNVGAEAANLELSRKRAIAVKKYLYDLGIPNRRLQHNAKGELSPIADNATEVGKSKNRRVEFRFEY
ncbi:MAG: outer membrane protein OmpA-like peptidoglycan-associated protein [Vicingaceae bacterium]|jgi:outer membrane protein OmpA-like peptidoglycan-associated protein